MMESFGHGSMSGVEIVCDIPGVRRQAFDGGIPSPLF